MTKVPLQDIATIHGGGRLKLSSYDFVPEGVPAYGAGGRNGFVAAAEYADREAVILSSIGARCGKCFHVSGAWTSLANTQVILPDPSRVDPRFLWFQLNDEARWPRSGSAQPFIKPSDVKAQGVWLPPLDEQRRIVAILEQADSLRSKRRLALAHLDMLTQSIFLDMFGQPESEWPRVTVGEIADVKGGKRLPKGVDYAAGTTSHPYIRVVDLKGGAISTADLRYLTSDVQESISRYTVRAHNVVISIAGSIGLVASVPEELDGANLTENAAKLVPSQEDLYESEWLVAALRSADLQAQIRSHVGQVTIGKLALFRIEKISLSLPPIQLQRRFLKRVRKTSVLRGVLDPSSRALEALFEALQARAFRGDL